MDDGKKSNSHTNRIITKRKNVDDENSHSNVIVKYWLKNNVNNDMICYNASFVN